MNRIFDCKLLKFKLRPIFIQDQLGKDTGQDNILLHIILCFIKFRTLDDSTN